MSRIAEKFRSLRESGSRALIPYLTGGYPHPDATLELLQALERGGADIIELGVPFSDPIADGPTIQRASTAALEAGTTLPRILEIVAEFRRNSQLPLVLFGAFNPFLHYGLEQFAKDASAAGVDGVLIPDLPAEEGDEVEPVTRKYGLDLIYLVAPTTPRERKSEICRHGSGFLYYISLKGVTGARTSITYELEQPLQEIRQCSDLPVAVGFGISTPEQAVTVARWADGVVVGSALIDVIARAGDAAPREAETFLRSIRNALDAAAVGNFASASST